MLAEGKNSKEELKEFAAKIVDIVVVKSQDNKHAFEPEGLIVAGFIADKGGE